MTEYNFGAGDHISGGLAQADVLGILGREGVALANYWGNGPGVGDLPAYVAAAFKLYRNYDGKGGHFGDTAITASTANLESATIYAATDSKKPGTVTVLIINKDQQKNFRAKLGLDAAQKYGKAEAYVLDGSKAEVRPAGAVPVTGNKLEYSLPPLSAVLFVLEKG
jgi:mannan endo-1,4-beta-mannosidase